MMDVGFAAGEGDIMLMHIEGFFLNAEPYLKVKHDLT